MRQVAVRGDLQGKGLGTILVKASEKFAIDKGYKKIHCDARETAIKFYERLGYRSSGKIFEQVTIPHIYMEKLLSSA